MTRVEKSSEKWCAPPCLTCWVRLGVDVQRVGDIWIRVCGVVCHAAFKKSLLGRESYCRISVHTWAINVD